MILENIAKVIEKSGKSRYQISKDTDVDQAVLCRIVSGGSCSIETADILCKYFGLELKPKKKRGKLIAFKFGRKTAKVVIGKKKKAR
jgi:hypothetical protein